MAGKGPALKTRNNRRKRVELRGEVRAADLDGGRFSLRLDDGTRVVARFTSDQEGAITEALRDHASRRLYLRGSAELAPSGKIKSVAVVELLAVEPVEEEKRAPSGKPIWEVALEIGAGIPDEQWAEVPTDLAKNLHHYLYGAPKEQQG